MADVAPIKNPIEWSAERLGSTLTAVGRAAQGLERAEEAPAHPAVRRIEVADLRDAIERGFGDLGAYRSDVLFLCLVYPAAGLLLAWLSAGYQMLPLLFPLVSGFALIGPVAAIGLYEISRRRERGDAITWADAFGVVRAPAFGAIVALGLLLIAIFLGWLAAAWGIYQNTLGPQPPTSLESFVQQVIGTPAGWAMIVLGCSVGFVFALVVLSISVVSFPLLLDRDVGVWTAVSTSIRAVATNPGPMAAWGVIVAGSLVLGSLPALLGLIIVMPVLGHATWHLYRKIVPRERG